MKLSSIILVFVVFTLKYSIEVHLDEELREISKVSNLRPLIPSEAYTHSLTVDEDNPDQYRLFWRFNDTDIQFEIHCKTNGWVGLGLSPNGGMAGSDIAIGWVDASGAYVKDCHAIGEDSPKIDKSQDWFLLDGAQINGYTILKYRRKLDTCDKLQDRPIKTGTSYLIFAWNDEDPKDNNWQYHGRNRLTRSQLLLNYPVENIIQSKKLPSDVITVDLRIPNVTIPVKETFYFCDLFKLPEFKQDMHLIGYEVLVSKANKKYAHHLLGYECEDNFVPPEPLARECGPVQIPLVFPQNCMNKLVIGWGIGGEVTRSFPKNTGYLFKANRKSHHLFFEMHYDNYFADFGVVDDTGVRLYLSPTLREHNLGVILLNTNVLPIPPRSRRVAFTTICYPECTNTFLPENGIYAISGFLHTHLAGRSLKTVLVRDGKAISNLFNDPNYDADYQNPTEIEPTNLRRGDALITECGYNTEQRNKFTTFGFGTYDEMCINFLYYYPQIPDFLTCGTQIPMMDLYKLYHSLMKEKVIPEIYGDPFNMSTYWLAVEQSNENLKKINFTEDLVKRFEDFIAAPRNRTLYCGAPGISTRTVFDEYAPDYVPTENLIKEIDNCVENPENGGNNTAFKRDVNYLPSIIFFVCFMVNLM